MKYIIILMLFFPACQTNAPTIEERVHQYMKDSVVPTFNDPASYQFVSMEMDTLTVKELSNRIQKAGAGEMFADELKVVRQNDGTPDKILYINVDVSCRGKNKFGGLILNKVKLKYHPETNSFTVR